MSQKIYRSMQGKNIELDKLIMRNETVVAVGNAKVNARGDELGPGGKIIKRVSENDTVYRTDSVVTAPRQRKVEEVKEEPVQSTVVDKRPRARVSSKSEEAGE